MAEDSELTKQQKEQEHVKKHVTHAMSVCQPGQTISTTYRWRSDIGGKMHVTVGIDEFGVVCNMFINVGSSGTQMHNICNALGRVISLCIQNDKATLIQIVETLEDFRSECVWMSDSLGRAKSIPSVIALILERHLRVEEQLETIHTGESDDE
jgi:hypothetical protein